MRFLYVFTGLVIGSFAWLSLAPEAAQACDPPFYGGMAYYRPAPVYYYAPPVYYQPRVYYYQPPYAPGYSAARPTTTVSVGAYDNYFQPGTIHVQPGTTVRFVNSGRHPHTVTSNDRLFDSGDLAPGAAYSMTFTRPGTYYYYCRHHTAEKMQGVIVVGGPSPGGYSGSPGY